MDKKLDEMYEALAQKYGIDLEIVCNEEAAEQYSAMLAAGTSLPEGVRQSPANENVFFRKKGDVSRDQLDKVLMLGLFNDIKSIKGYITFFTALTILNVLAALIVIFA